MPNEHTNVDCGSAMRQLWDFVDAELTPERMASVERHLAECRHCHPHAEFAERFIAALHDSREDRPCPKEVRARVMAKLREAGLVLD